MITDAGDLKIQYEYIANKKECKEIAFPLEQ
jgi:hypothetical protein